MILAALIFALALPAQQPAADNLKAITAEPNLVKRAKLALANGERASRDAGDACKAGEYDKCNARLSEVQDSVELAEKSLDQTGIDPARSPRHFKDAELQTHKILREVDPLRAYIPAEGMDHFQSVYRRISSIDDRLVSAILSKKKKKK
ncbi:MAG TPA: hypothetical protein VEU62_00810 [Bryobacterales bacterium]|nr:hypothetical protein [Bryobacterales bacterium]